MLYYALSIPFHRLQKQPLLVMKSTVQYGRPLVHQNPANSYKTWFPIADWWIEKMWTNQWSVVGGFRFVLDAVSAPKRHLARVSLACALVKDAAGLERGGVDVQRNCLLRVGGVLHSMQPQRIWSVNSWFNIRSSAIGQSEFSVLVNSLFL